MKNRVLILGGQGRIGSSVATDLLNHTQAEVTITGRSEKGGQAFATQAGPRLHFLALDLSDREALLAAIASSDLVIHCAGPFRHRDTGVLEACIAGSVDYLDVSDDRTFTRNALALRASAAASGITAIVNSGIFPGISNSMVRQSAEELDELDRIHLSYVVQGSGGAGVTVLRTTFLALSEPFEAWIDGQWQIVLPYSERERVEFDRGPGNVYWFDMPECFTLPETFKVKTVITKFGVEPDFYNHLTWMSARWFPPALMRNPGFIEMMSQMSYRMTSITDPMSGIGVRMRAEVTGIKNGQPVRRVSLLSHPDTTVACGIGTGSLAELMLAGLVSKPGVWTVDESLPTALFEKVMASRKLMVLRV